MGWSSKYPNEGTSGNHKKNPWEVARANVKKLHQPPVTTRPLVAKLAPRRFMDVTSPVLVPNKTSDIKKNTSVGWIFMCFFVEFWVLVMDDDIEFVCVYCIPSFLNPRYGILIEYVFLCFCGGGEKFKKSIWATCFCWHLQSLFQPRTSKTGIENWWRKDLGLSSLK